MKRVVLFLITNIAVLAVLWFVLSLVGIEQYLFFQEQELDIPTLLLFAAIVGFGGSFISLAVSKWMAKRMTGAQVIEQPGDATEQWLVDTVRRLARQAGIGMPEVALYRSAEMNAFATGARRDNALVAVSSGLLENMTAEEVEAVLAHEVSHVANGDMITMALIQGVVNTFVIALSRIIGHVVDKAVFKTERGHGPAYWITAIIAELVLAILASIIVFWFSRQREFRADAGSARLVGREPMIAALKRLGAQYGQAQLPDQMAAFGISGGVGQGLKRLFMTHPPLAERIARLQAAG